MSQGETKQETWAKGEESAPKKSPSYHLGYEEKAPRCQTELRLATGEKYVITSPPQEQETPPTYRARARGLS